MVVDYSNKKTINDVPVKADEVLVPIHAEEIAANYRNDLKEGLRTKGDGINLNNLETWHLGGRKILVGFIAVKKDKAEAVIINFWREVNSYIEATRKKNVLLLMEKVDLNAAHAKNHVMNVQKAHSLLMNCLLMNLWMAQEKMERETGILQGI